MIISVACEEIQAITLKLGRMKLLLGGSPCTHWSVAQTRNRETEPSGLGWELFLNYKIARDKYQPDYFLYENNKSMSPAIRAQITKELGVEPMLVNSALVSAQNRQRLYWVGKRNTDGTYSQIDVEQPENRGMLLRDILENSMKAKAGLYAMPIEIDGFVSGESTDGSSLDFLGGITNTHKKWLDNGKNYSRNFGQGYRLYGVNGKATTQTAQGCGIAGNTGLYAVPIEPNHITSVAFDKGGQMTAEIDGRKCVIYEVRDEFITIKGEKYPVKLADGLYVIRRLTVSECKRLQTVPKDYVFPVSDTQAYKMLGNGWTVDIIAHIMSHFEGIDTAPVEVLSMYDGMSCGHIALDKLGAKVARYYATEIDKYAIQTTQANYPDTVQLGDAFQVRDEDWDGGGLLRRR